MHSDYFIIGSHIDCYVNKVAVWGLVGILQWSCFHREERKKDTGNEFMTLCAIYLYISNAAYCRILSSIILHTYLFAKPILYYYQI
jgi:hypothetical protein